MRGPGRGALVAGLLALLFGVIAGFEVTLHEKPKFDSRLEQATDEKPLQAAEGDFDYIMFSQRWPGTYCKQPGACCENVEDTSIFTVNGFWPENDDGSYPSCCEGPAYDQNELGYLVNLLEHFWPKASCSSPTQCNGKEAESLWHQEWEKHGTCFYPLVEGPSRYFQVAMVAAEIIDMAKILKDAGYVPDSSEEHDTSELTAAVEKAVGATPQVTCKGNHIYEIRLCFTKEMERLDCPSSSDKCPASLVFPPYES